MVVCKFFLQGNCRFGNNCRFDHQISEAKQQQLGQQHHTSVLRQQNFNPSPNTQIATTTNTTVDTPTLIQAVINDATTVENSGQWLLSCYAPFKEKPNFPGFEEQSFEEIRWGYCEAQRLGTVDQYRQQLQMSLQSAVLNLRSLQNPSHEAVVTIINIYNYLGSSSTSDNSSFGNNGFGNNQSSIFGNQSNSIFGQASNFGNNMFNQQQDSASNSIFATANQQLFSNTQSPSQNSIFGNNQATNNTLASTGSFTQQPSIFGQQPGIGNFASASQNNGFFNTPPNGASPFNIQNRTSQFNAQQTSASPFNAQQTSASPFNVQPQTATAPFNAPLQNGSFPFSKVQDDPRTVFNMQQQSAPTAFNTQQNTNTNGSLFASHFGIQQQNNTMFSQQQPNSLFNVQENSQTNVNPFGGPNSVFGGNVQSALLNSANGTTHSNSIFGSTQSTVIENNNASLFIDESIYSKLEDLNEEDIKSYGSDKFEFGKIPEKPPTIEMCF